MNSPDLVADLMALSPILVIGAAAIGIMLVLAFRRDHAMTAALTLGGVIMAFASLFVAANVAPRPVTALLVIDGYAIFFMGLIFAATYVVTLLSHGYLDGRSDQPDEFYILLLLAALGAAVLAASTHFASFFLGLEILSVSLYTLIAYRRRNPFCIEAAIKYLILAAVSAAFLLLGMALVYARLGTMDFAEIARLISAASASGESWLLPAGLALIIVGIGFKLAIVPFHLWTPDVYQGAPAPATAFIATVSKGAMFALLLRFAVLTDLRFNEPVFLVFTIIAVASMLVGNLLALLQTNVKRMLAYSSIAHLGYLLVTLLAGGTLAITAASYYLAAYFVTTLGAFGVITVLSGKDRDADRLEDYRGLARRYPWLAAVFTVMLLSLAGIPLTAGFIGKFYLLAAGVYSTLWLLVIVLVATSALGLFYYLRLILVMFARLPQEPVGPEEVEADRGILGPAHPEAEVACVLPVAPPPLPLAGQVALGGLAVVLVFLGIFPAPLIAIIQRLAAVLY
jgi:NADH-quinone oxidoreductase subunit N